ncbi:MAG: TonB-dependent receptor [Bacteroidetes bacterium]|nr:TonB-dependent receptor [Bacteroidota bacterium]MBU1718750.1 TonB-dependent receptor [Bacteroidota bacterium]
MKTQKFIQTLRRTFALLVGLVLIPQAFAQTTGEIKGRIIVEITGEPVPFANVYVEEGDKLIGTTSDLDGYYTLKPLQPGTYNLNFSTVEYQKKVITGVAVNPGKITMIGETELSGNTLGGYEVIEWTIPLIDAEEPSKKTMLAADLEDLPSRASISDILRCTSSDVYVNENNEIFFRGTRSDASCYYVDGIRMPGNNMGIPGSAIGSMTVYSGGVPANYGDFTGGVVVIETKSYFSWLNEKRRREMKRKMAKGK